MWVVVDLAVKVISIYGSCYLCPDYIKLNIYAFFLSNQSVQTDFYLINVLLFIVVTFKQLSLCAFHFNIGLRVLIFQIMIHPSPSL
jgi:hypothetical protein